MSLQEEIKEESSFLDQQSGSVHHSDDLVNEVLNDILLQGNSKKNEHLAMSLSSR